MPEITAGGVPVLIAPDSSRRTQHRPGWTGGAYDFMRRVLATEQGAERYEQRAQLIEPIFGNTRHNRGYTRFARRRRAAAQTEWRPIAAAHNLPKLASTSPPRSKKVSQNLSRSVPRRWRGRGFRFGLICLEALGRG